MPVFTALIPIKIPRLSQPRDFFVPMRRLQKLQILISIQYSRPNGYAECGCLPQAAFPRSHVILDANGKCSATFSPKADLPPTWIRFCPKKQAVLRIKRLPDTASPENPAFSRTKCFMAVTSPETCSFSQTKCFKRRTTPFTQREKNRRGTKKRPQVRRLEVIFIAAGGNAWLKAYFLVSLAAFLFSFHMYASNITGVPMKMDA